MGELQGFLKLLKTGSIEKATIGLPIKVLLIIRLLILLSVLKAVSLGLIYLLDYLGVFSMPVNQNRLKFESILDVETLIYTSVFAPILEEFSFRLPLRFSKWNLFIASIGLSFIFCKVVIGLGWLHSFFIALPIGVFLLSSMSEIRLSSLNSLFISHKRAVFYLLLLSFSFLHISNYETTIELLIFSPIIILPRFLGGLVFSYARLRLGIVFAVCLHAFNNGIFRLMELLN